MAKDTVKIPGVTIVREARDPDATPGPNWSRRVRQRARATVELELNWHLLAEVLGSKAWKNKSGRARACGGLVTAVVKKVEVING